MVFRNSGSKYYNMCIVLGGRKKQAGSLCYKILIVGRNKKIKQAGSLCYKIYIIR